MKKVMILEGISLGLNIVSVAVGLLTLPRPYALWQIGLLSAGGLSAVCLGVSLWETVRQQRIMEFLIQDNRKRKKTTIAWEENEAEKLGILRRRIDLTALQMQINPHFLYNTLDSIRGQALLNGQSDIALMTEKLSKFFRYCISNKENMVKIREEADHIQDYYYIQKQRFGERFEMELHVENDILFDYYIPKLTLQPLVENTIMHGLEKVKRKGIVTISIFETEQKVIVKVSDNGIGMSESELEILNERLKLEQARVTSKKGRGNGIAITNVNSRIKLTFGKEYGIHYRSYENVGTEAIVTLPKVDEFARVQYEDILMMESEQEKPG